MKKYKAGQFIRIGDSFCRVQNNKTNALCRECMEENETPPCNYHDVGIINECARKLYFCMHPKVIKKVYEK